MTPSTLSGSEANILQMGLPRQSPEVHSGETSLYNTSLMCWGGVRATRGYALMVLHKVVQS